MSTAQFFQDFQNITFTISALYVTALGYKSCKNYVDYLLAKPVEDDKPQSMYDYVKRLPPSRKSFFRVEDDDGWGPWSRK